MQPDPPTALPAEARRPWQAFFEAHAAVVRRLEAELEAEHGLSLRWYDVLVHLAAAPGRQLLMRELSAAVVISKGGLTKLIDRMAEAGLVAREPTRANRRITPVRLTEQGLATYRRARSTHHRGVAEHFLDHLTADERRTLRRALERVRDAEAAAARLADGDAG
jgi:DNA-binding MarR family transcriptional regulator